MGDLRVPKLFFLLSGENPSLPSSELISILEAENHEYRILERLTQVLRIESERKGIRSIKLRSSMTRICCLELFVCDAVLREIEKELDLVSLEDLIESGQSFGVRVRRVRGVASHLKTVELERRLGDRILTRAKGLKVSLSNPQKVFFGILTENRFLFGLKMAEISPRPFVDRSPRKRPFFHPTAMPAKLARCMVNLAQPKAGDLVLDPFCGTASVLVEAWLIGCRVIGFDVQPRMVKGSAQNLLRYGAKPSGIAVADARNLPIGNVDCVVTDPPYGRAATTLRCPPQQIVEEFLSTVGDTLHRRRRICIASPRSFAISKIGAEFDLEHLESHFVYVHRSLTREIAVFERS